MNESHQTGPRNPAARPLVCLSFRSSSPPSRSATTSPRCFGGGDDAQRRRLEVIFVDDNSPDGTWEWCGAWHGRTPASAVSPADRTARPVRRLHWGILASSAPYVAVIDADLQHDETQLPAMLALLQGGEFDLVVGSLTTLAARLVDKRRRRPPSLRARHRKSQTRAADHEIEFTPLQQRQHGRQLGSRHAANRRRSQPHRPRSMPGCPQCRRRTGRAVRSADTADAESSGAKAPHHPPRFRQGNVIDKDDLKATPFERRLQPPKQRGDVVAAP